MICWVNLGNTVNLNMNYIALTTMYESDIRIHTVVTSHGAGKVTYHEKLLSEIVNNLFFYQNNLHFGEDTFIHCSWITIIHVHVNIFVQNLPRTPQRRNGIKPRSN